MTRQSTSNAIERVQQQPIQVRQPTAASNTWTYRPYVDIIETADAFMVKADLPGTTREAINVNVERSVLTIQADVAPRWPQQATWHVQTYGIGAFHRRFEIGDSINTDAISADYQDGVLTVTLPKKEEAQSRRIQINAA